MVEIQIAGGNPSAMCSINLVFIHKGNLRAMTIKSLLRSEGIPFGNVTKGFDYTGDLESHDVEILSDRLQAFPLNYLYEYYLDAGGEDIIINVEVEAAGSNVYIGQLYYLFEPSEPMELGEVKRKLVPKLGTTSIRLLPEKNNLMNEKGDMFIYGSTWEGRKVSEIKRYHDILIEEIPITKEYLACTVI